MNDFYDSLAPFYHLIYQDWHRSIERQGQQLTHLLSSEWPAAKTVLDVSCGIGTQSIALARNGYHVAGSDLSTAAIKRARKESEKYAVDITFSVCDMRELVHHHSANYDILISADNSIPHLLSDEEIVQALSQMYSCLKPGGGCVITIRDYEKEERGVNLVKPYGIRVVEEKRFLVFQVWDFEGDMYELTFFFIEENLSTKEVISHSMRTMYYAISTRRLTELMKETGFNDVRAMPPDVFYQPVVVGTKQE